MGVDKSKWFCDHCKKQGHLKEDCFELIGYPNWYKDMVKMMQNSTNKPWNSSLEVNVPLESHAKNTDFLSFVSDMIKQEVSCMFKERDMDRELNDPISAHCIQNMANNHCHFSQITLLCSELRTSKYKILDNKAT